MIINKRGFTIIELMIAILVIGILASTAYPRLISTRNGQRYSSSLRDIKAALQSARLTAMRESLPVTTEFSPATNSFRVFRDNDGNGNLDSGDGDSILTTGSMQKYVTLVGTDFAGVGANKTQFNKEGFPVGLAGQLLSGTININFRPDSTQTHSGTIELNAAGSIIINK